MQVFFNYGNYRTKNISRCKRIFFLEMEYGVPGKLCENLMDLWALIVQSLVYSDAKH